MAYDITTVGDLISVNNLPLYGNPTLKEAAQRLHGKWYRADRCYTFPAEHRPEIEAIVADLNATQQDTPTPPTPATTQHTTGWSKAARARRGEHTTSHPLGERISGGNGYTLYQDDINGGTVQIWDES